MSNPNVYGGQQSQYQGAPQQGGYPHQFQQEGKYPSQSQQQYPGYPQQPQQGYPQQPHHQNSQQYGQEKPGQPQMRQPSARAPMSMSGASRNPLNKPLDKDGKREWNHGLCDCCGDCGTCFLGWCCPCVLYAKNKQRLDHLERTGQPDPEHGGSGCDGNCCIWYCVGCIFPMNILTRADTRRRYGLAGNDCSSCMSAYCCILCDLVQTSREIQDEEDFLTGRLRPQQIQ